MEQVRTIAVGDTDFEHEVLKPQVPVLVDFWAPWCGPCRMLEPVLEKIAQEYQGRLKVCKVNVEQGRKTISKYGVMSVPTLYLYKDGKVVSQLTGMTADYESAIRKKLAPHLARTS